MKEISAPLRVTLFAAGVAVSYAAVVLYIFPERSAHLFAWDIQPPVTAAFMGANYALALPLVFLLARRETPWLQARPLLPPLFVLSVTMLVATALHADRFIWSNMAAWLWLVLYIIYPPLLFLLYVRHARDAGPDPAPVVEINRAMRSALLVPAIALGGLGLALMIAPIEVAGLWPWELTALTARVVGGWLLQFAAALAAMSRERDWIAIRLLLPQAGLTMALLLGATLRFRESFSWSDPSAWVYVGILAGGFVVNSATFIRFESMRLRSERRGQPSKVKS